MTSISADKMREQEDEETQTLFDGVDRIIEDYEENLKKSDEHVVPQIIPDLLTLAKAVQSLRPSTSPTTRNSQCDPATMLVGEAMSSSSQEHTLWLEMSITGQERDLILHMRKEKLSAEKLISYLSDPSGYYSTRQFIQSIQEDS